MPIPVRLRPFALTAALLLSLAGCVRNPEAEARAAQQFLEIGDALNDLRQTTSVLDGTVDSLRTVIAKQDTTITRLAAATGVPVAR
jgi:hypothetical protein